MHILPLCHFAISSPVKAARTTLLGYLKDITLRMRRILSVSLSIFCYWLNPSFPLPSHAHYDTLHLL
jgi:hypothetical protein